MTKWEYLVLTCDNIPSVFWINGDRPKKIEHDTVTLFGGGGRELQEPYLFEYLREAGKMGWEVCGLSPINGSNGASQSIFVILKRPFEE